MATWTRCGTCGAATRFIGSHVLQAHVAYASPFGDRSTARMDTIADALASERSARVESIPCDSTTERIAHERHEYVSFRAFCPGWAQSVDWQWGGITMPHRSER